MYETDVQEDQNNQGPSLKLRCERRSGSKGAKVVVRRSNYLSNEITKN